MTVRIDDFKAALSGGGFRPNYFRVIPSFPNGGDIQLSSFMIKSAQMPTSTVGEILIPFRGRQMFVAGDRTFDPWTLTVINDTNFAVRDAFEIWSNAISSHVANEGTANDVSAYYADWTLEALGKNGETIKTYKMVGCWPQAIDPIEVSYDNTDTISEFGVSMRFLYWTSRTTDQ